MAVPDFSGKTAPSLQEGTLDAAGLTIPLASNTNTAHVYIDAVGPHFYRWGSNDAWAKIDGQTWLSFAVGGGGPRITSMQLKGASGTPAVSIDCSPFARS